MPPLHERTEKLIKEKKDLLESQRNSKKLIEDSEISKSCTFQPKASKSRDYSRSRSPEGLTKELYQWNENRQKSLERLRKEKEYKETLEIITKPRIGNLSQKLSQPVTYT